MPEQKNPHSKYKAGTATLRYYNYTAEETQTTERMASRGRQLLVGRHAHTTQNLARGTNTEKYSAEFHL